MKFDIKMPCKSCPYRLDAPLARWHRAHFEKLLQSEESDFGAVYACHGTGKLPEQSACAGWFLDQRRRGLPSIALRLALSRGKVDRAEVDAFDPDGLEMFESVEAMCEANLRRDDALRAAGVNLDDPVEANKHSRRPIDRAFLPNLDGRDDLSAGAALREALRQRDEAREEAEGLAAFIDEVHPGDSVADSLPWGGDHE